MTDRERIAALELSNQRIIQVVQDWAEAGNIDNYSQLSDKLEALSSSEPSKVVEVLRRILEVFEYDAGRCAYTYTRCVNHGGRANPCCNSDEVKAIAALREIL